MTAAVLVLIRLWYLILNLLGLVVGCSAQTVELFLLDTTRGGRGASRWRRAVALRLVLFRPATTATPIGRRAHLLRQLSVCLALSAADFHFVLLVPLCFCPGSKLRRQVLLQRENRVMFHSKQVIFCTWEKQILFCPQNNVNETVLYEDRNCFQRNYIIL